MQIIARRRLAEFWAIHARAKTPLQEWHSVVRVARWDGPADIRARFASADFVADNRVIFDIAGNRYRLVVHVDYLYKRVLVKFVGTHAAYDGIDAETVK